MNLEDRIAKALADAATPEELAELDKLNVTADQRAERRQAGSK